MYSKFDKGFDIRKGQNLTVKIYLSPPFVESWISPCIELIARTAFETVSPTDCQNWIEDSGVYK